MIKWEASLMILRLQLILQRVQTETETKIALQHMVINGVGKMAGNP